jgi:hypothetical protein
MASGVFLFLCLSLLLSAVSSISVVAFGTSVISDLSNSARNSNGLDSLTVNSKLTNAAQNKANAMVAGGYFEHTAPDGTTGWDYISSSGYKYLFAGENLAASNEDDVNVVNGWLNSPSHRANLLSSTYTEVGYGVAYAGDYAGYENVYFIVALYANPQPIPAAVKPVATTTVSTPPTVTEVTAPIVAETLIPAPIVNKELVPLAVATDNTSPGVKTLADNKFAMNSQLSFGLITLGTTLSVSGMAVEARRLFRHPRNWRH